MKRILSILGVALAACLLVSCGQKAAKPCQAENEIVTYQRVDPDKTVLVVSKTGNVFPETMYQAFEAKNPDVQIVGIDISGGNSTISPVADWVSHGLTPDIMIAPKGIFPTDLTVNGFTDLSASPWIESYNAEALYATAVDSRIYFLPGPSQIDCMLYNKTLFEQYGWEVPATFDQFVALCLRIREDTGGTVQPWNPNAKYSSEFSKVTQGFVYAELFSGLENRTWYEDFCAGTATFADHMEPYYQMLQTLIDNGILLEEHFSYSATTRGKEFAAGQIAMINYHISDIESDTYEFDFMPFPTTQGDLGYVCNNIPFLIGVPKTERTEQVQDAVDRFLAFLTSAEGQNAFIGNSLMISSVKDVPLNQAEKLASLQPAIEQGHLFNDLKFPRVSGKTVPSFDTDAQRMLRGEMTASQCIAAVDTDPLIVEEQPAPEPPVAVVTAAEAFTTLETSFLMADMYRQTANADVGLIVQGVAYRGNVMRIFPGELTAAHINTLLPRSLANGSTLVKASMTGQQLLDALNHPVGNDCTADAVYAYSGLQCKIAPWNPLGEKYVSVARTNGTLDPDTLYTVAFWDGTVADEYITAVLETYEGTWEELMTAYLGNAETIAPVHDGRCKLIWD